jgi:hypothetical protein
MSATTDFRLNMRGKQLNLEAYDTDKINHHYLDVYDPILAAWRDSEVKLLEIGVHKGGSLQLWRDYFPRGRIVGIDLKLPKNFVPGERIEVFEGSQADTRFLSEVAAKTAPGGFDVIIDDASHLGELTKTTFWHLFERHLKPGGLYAIEDWGTGYLSDFPDGKKFDPKPSARDPFPCHSNGMVGFVKELVDEQCAGSITLGRNEQVRSSNFESLLITPGVVFVTKMMPALTASPNPVPPGEGLGRTTISWSSVDGRVYVSVDEGNEVLFADVPFGSLDADWIGESSSYEFRLYNSDHTELLDKVVVQTSNSLLYEAALATGRTLWTVKVAQRPKSFWYPFSTLHNVAALERLSAAAGFQLLDLCRGPHARIADIGAADGDLAFFLEKQGLSVDIIDNEYTNFNGLEGARTLKDALSSSVVIRSVDLDSQFSPIGQKYDVIFFLGTLYHLKNPYFVLESLARMTKYCFVSTRIAKQTADGQPLSSYPLAYLLGPQECNGDDTNFWIFSDYGLKRLVDRTGWNLLSYVTIGDTASSTPADPERDERAFCLLEKRPPFLNASPNPVPGGGRRGKTTISWDTADGSIGKVYVSVNRGTEAFFADGRRGSALADWIEAGSNYEFRLYNSDHTEILAKVTVPTARRSNG